MTIWTDHVKRYAQQNGISYKDALSEAKHTYTKINGGDLNSAMRKTGNTLKRIEKNSVNFVNQSNKQLQKGKVAARKTKNTVNRILKESQPLISLASPELGVATAGLRTTLGGKIKLGSKHNQYARGGSFSEFAGGSVKNKKSHHYCPTCGSISGSGINNNSIINHPSFNATGRKSFYEQ